MQDLHYKNIAQDLRYVLRLIMLYVVTILIVLYFIVICTSTLLYRLHHVIQEKVSLSQKDKNSKIMLYI